MRLKIYALFSQGHQPLRHHQAPRRGPRVLLHLLAYYVSGFFPVNGILYSQGLPKGEMAADGMRILTASSLERRRGFSFKFYGGYFSDRLEFSGGKSIG